MEGGEAIYGHGATVAYGSPKPLIWVRILVPVLNKKANDSKNLTFNGSMKTLTFKSLNESDDLNDLNKK